VNKNNLIQVFEHNKLKIGENGFSENHFKALLEFNEQNNNKYFTPIYKGILFNSYVGVIQIGGLTIEILPKADNSDNKDLWQSVLLHMLKKCRKIQTENISETHLKKKYKSILEAYYELYLQEIEYLLKRGFIKQYKRIQSNQLALKGKLLFCHNIQKNLIHKEKFYCEHQTYNCDHLIHQILQKGLLILKKLNFGSLNDRINRILLEFDSVEKFNIEAKHFFKIKLNRKSQPYEKALNIAKMLILNFSPNINSGNENMLTLLFDMNQLWEEYIYRILYKHKPEGFLIQPQSSNYFWENKTIRPDIVISNASGEQFIIDTKWKILKDNSKPHDADLKQMFVYNLHWKSSKSMLLYPKINQEDSEFGSYHYKHLKNLPNQCKIGFINILINGQIKRGKELSDEIFRKCYD
jgi:5-methylcytosine-specific restriction enzyme subunit McrC